MQKFDVHVCMAAKDNEYHNTLKIHIRLKGNHLKSGIMSSPLSRIMSSPLSCQVIIFQFSSI